MGCFCHSTVSAMQQVLQQADDAPPPAQRGPAAQAVTAAARHLAARALPAPPWQPDAEWLDEPLPEPQTDPAGVATLSALATLRHQAQEQLGIDPLQPAQAKPFRRIVATLNARLTELASTKPSDPAPWQQLAEQSEAAEQVRQAAESGMLDPSPEQHEAYTRPAGRPMRQWLPLLRQVRALAPLIAATTYLGENLDDPADLPARLAAAVRPLRSLALPPLADAFAAGQLLALLSALDRLQRSLGTSPLQLGGREARALVDQQVAEAARVLPQQPSQNELPYCPSTFAPAAVVEAMRSPAAVQLAAIRWNVPSISELPVLHSGLLATALAQAMTSILPQPPVRQTPCAAGCDAARIMRTLDAA